MLDSNRDREKELAHFIRWAKDQPLVRAAVLTSTLAAPGAAVDILSDYDIILILTDVRPFFDSRDWLKAFGQVLALYRDPLENQDGFLKSGYVIQFADNLKIDFTLLAVEIWQQRVAAPTLEDELDAGYRILLDKDHLTDGLKPPTYRAYIPTPPSEARYRELIENFFVDSTYVAKFLWRDDLAAAKHILDHFMKQENLIPMLEWLVEIEHGWSVKPGPYGRGLKKRLRPDLWSALEATYAGPDPQENWHALFQTIDLMHAAASEVGRYFGYAYPVEIEQGITAHLFAVKNQK